MSENEKLDISATLADLRGVPGMRAPPRVQFLFFSMKFSEKNWLNNRLAPLS